METSEASKPRAFLPGASWPRARVAGAGLRARVILDFVIY
jgi:hypothetical protein